MGKVNLYLDNKSLYNEIESPKLTQEKKKKAQPTEQSGDLANLLVHPEGQNRNGIYLKLYYSGTQYFKRNWKFPRNHRPQKASRI